MNTTVSGGTVTNFLVGDKVSNRINSPYKETKSQTLE